MNRKAFTLIELLVVVAIIGILAEDNLMDSIVAISASLTWKKQQSFQQLV